MKKISQLILGFVVIFALAACGDKEQTTTFVHDESTGSEVTYTHKGDVISKQAISSKVEYATLGLESIDDAKKALEDQIKLYNDIDGVTATIDYKDDYFVETMTFDFDKLTPEQLNDLTGGNLSDANKKDVLSLEKVTETLEKQGYKKK